MSDVRRIDDYLDALARDPNALPPDGLDAGLAETARRVRAAGQVAPLDQSARARLWATVLDQVRVEEELRIDGPRAVPSPVLHGNGAKGEPMTQSIPHVLTFPARRAGRRSFALPLVAALIGVIVLTALLWLGSFGGLPTAGWLLQATPTPTSVLPTFPPYQNNLFVGQQATPGGPITDLTADRDQVFTGTLTAEQPVAVYHLTGGQPGLALMQVDSASEITIFLGISDQLVSAQAFTSLIVGPAGMIDAGDPWYVYVGSAGPVTEPVAYQLSIRIFAAAEESSAALAYGDTVAGHFDGRHLPLYSFQGAAGDVIRAAVETQQTVDSEILLFQSRLYGFDDDSGPGFDPELLDYVLYLDGAYVLAIVPKATDAVGDFQLTLEHTGQQALPTAPANPDTSAALREATRLTPGEPERASLPPEGYAGYRFRAEERGLYAVRVTSDDPAGPPTMQYSFRLTAFNQRPGTGNVAPLATGLDLLDVYPVADVLLTVIGAPGQAYMLIVTPLAAVDLTLDAPVDGTLTEALPLAIYSLHLHADEVVTLTASGQDGFDTRLALFDWRWQPLVEDLRQRRGPRSGDQRLRPTGGQRRIRGRPAAAPGRARRDLQPAPGFAP